MRPLTVLLWVVQIAVMLGGLFFLYRVLGHARRVKASGAPGFAPLTPGVANGTWNAVVTQEGKHPNFSGQRGHVRIDNGWLGFHVDNDFKDMRERRYAGEFLSMLAYYGAHVSV